jgi:putative halogenase protein
MSSPILKLPEVLDEDLLIAGGGICGLTLAIQLKKTNSRLGITVLDRATYPLPEVIHKVGESSVEVQAHYLRDILGLVDHLENDQLRKFGLRMFFTHEDNTDIVHRVEYGQADHAPLHTYQLDRGRLENYLRDKANELGVKVLAGHRLRSVELGEDDFPHVAEVFGPQGQITIRSQWFVDATGRAGFLKRKLGLQMAVAHAANASWLRIDHEIDVDTWSTDQLWRDRVPSGLRRLSTNHLMGRGYWVWIIPLASGATSVGIVADARYHAHEGFDTLEKFLNWLGEREPQCAAELISNRQRIRDFRVMSDYAYGCQQVFSTRWFITGEAGVSIDPLYSSGGDLMAISNTLITDLIKRALEGEPIDEVSAAHNQLFLLLSQIWLVAYQDQYAIMGNAQVMVAKAIWDTIIYWAVPGLLHFQGAYPHLADAPALQTGLYRTWEIHTRVQQFLREWDALDGTEAQDAFADPYSLMDFLVDLHTGMAADLSNTQLETQLGHNVELLEHVAGQLFAVVIATILECTDSEAVAQVAAWQSDPEVQYLIERYHEFDSDDPLDPSWISLGTTGSVKRIDN